MKVEQNLRRHLHDPIQLCVITLMELYYGAHKSQKVTGNVAKIRMIENSMEILPVGREVVEIFGSEKAKLERRGTPIEDFDLILGCCALAHNLTLVTNNTRYLKKIEGLRLANWVEGTD